MNAQRAVTVSASGQSRRVGGGQESACPRMSDMSSRCHIRRDVPEPDMGASLVQHVFVPLQSLKPQGWAEYAAMLFATSIIGCWTVLMKPVLGLSRSWIRRITAATSNAMR